MDYRKLSYEITDVVVEALQHFDSLDNKGLPHTFQETQASIAGAVDRYRNDPIFRAKAQMLVSRITAVVQNNETHNGEVRGASVTAQPACEASSGEAATSTVLLGVTARND